MADLLEREDFEKLSSITQPDNETNDEGSALLVHLRSVLRNNLGVKSIDSGAAVLTEAQIVPMDVIGFEEAAGLTGGKHGLNFRFRKYLDALVKSHQWDNIIARTLCTGCRQPPNDPYVTSCFHIYCLACLNDLQHWAARKGYDGARCSECGETYTSTAPCEGLDSFNTREGTRASPDGDQQHAAVLAKRNGKKVKDGQMEDWITSIPGEVLPSTKTQAVKAQVLNFIDEDAKAKIIIYTQFLPMIRILAKICQTENWGFCK